MMASRIWFSWVFSTLAMNVIVGCTGSHLTLPDTVPVSGAVTRKGKPADGVRVKFHPLFDIGSVEFVPYGETGSDGKFTLSTGAPGNGAPRGDYLVTLEMPRIASDPADGLEAEIDLLKGAYSDPDSSQWWVTVKDGDNMLEPFELD